MNILLITHKDFATTRMNFEHLANLPFEKNIYFYNDLYKFESDAKECLEIRQLAVDNSDKIKDVYFTDANLGLKESVPRALDWYFSEVKYGVVVEYDCIISPKGFQFLKEAFLRFSEDGEVTSISVANITSFDHIHKVDFIKTLVTPIWGWASWRSEVEKWRNFTPIFEDGFRQSIREIGQKHASDWLLRNQNAFANGKTHTTWSDKLINYQLNEKKFSIVPSTNLVRNVGFNSSGTNSKPGSIFENLSYGNFEEFSDIPSRTSEIYNREYFKLANTQQKADLLKSKLNLKYILSRLKSKLNLKYILSKLKLK